MSDILQYRPHKLAECKNCHRYWRVTIYQDIDNYTCDDCRTPEILRRAVKTYRKRKKTIWRDIKTNG